MSFHTDLSLGSLGETLFLKACPGLKRLDGLKSDFVDSHTGEKIELKTDWYGLERTPNFFFERYSDKDKKTPGGPWSALDVGSTQFVYFYAKDLTYFVFNTQKLVDFLESISSQLNETTVRNSHFVTMGFKVPRDLTRHLYARYNIEMKGVAA